LLTDKYWCDVRLFEIYYDSGLTSLFTNDLLPPDSSYPLKAYDLATRTLSRLEFFVQNAYHKNLYIKAITMGL
jgi:hypothetical protein